MTISKTSSRKFRCTHCDQIVSMPFPHMIGFSRYCDNYTRDDYVTVSDVAEIKVRVNS